LTGKCFPLTEKCFSLTEKCFLLTNFPNSKQTQESLESGFPESEFRETNMAYISYRGWWVKEFSSEELPLLMDLQHLRTIKAVFTRRASQTNLSMQHHVRNQFVNLIA
jgi:hypothetical protein